MPGVERFDGAVPVGMERRRETALGAEAEMVGALLMSGRRLVRLLR